MSFWKNNSYDIVRLFINQVGITIFSLVMYFAVELTNIDKNTTGYELLVAISVFSTLFYLVLIYTASWEYGAKDKIKIDSGKISYSGCKGAILGVYANIPNFALAILALACIGIYSISGAEGFYTAFGLLNLPIRFLSSMYLGILQGAFASLSNQVVLHATLQTAGFALMPVFPILVGHLGYSLGVREKHLFSFAKNR